MDARDRAGRPGGHHRHRRTRGPGARPRGRDLICRPDNEAGTGAGGPRAGHGSQFLMTEEGASHLGWWSDVIALLASLVFAWPVVRTSLGFGEQRNRKSG